MFVPFFVNFPFTLSHLNFLVTQAKSRAIVSMCQITEHELLRHFVDGHENL